MAKSLVYRNAVLNALFGSGSPATHYIRLWTAAHNSDGTGGTEVAGGSYAPAAVTNNGTNFAAATAGEITNATAINFASATANWGTVVEVSIESAASGGTKYYFGALETARTINNGDSFSFAIDQLIIREG